MAPRRSILGIVVALIALGASSAWGHEAGELRVNAGLDLFPSFIAADIDIDRKTGADGSLLLVLVYGDDPSDAERLMRYLARVKTIRQRPLRIELVSDLDLGRYTDTLVAGIFLAEHLGKDRLSGVLEFAMTAKAIVVSPHEGDVEDGAGGGIHVSDRILPYVNVRFLERAGVRLKPFFLRIAEQYVD